MRGTLIALALALFAAAAAWAGHELEPVHSEQWTRDYDPHFRKYAKRYFGPHFDWRCSRLRRSPSRASTPAPAARWAPAA